jgi:hypothetical protein
MWWWFRVSTDDRHRYAPFEAAANDTQAGVRKRIVAYYEALLAARARPAANPWRRPDPKLAMAAKPAVPVALAVTGTPAVPGELAVPAK